MSRVEAKYSPWGVLAPILSIIVEIPSLHLAFEMDGLVDSGADSTVIDGGRLLEWGVDLDALPDLPGIAGVGGEVQSRAAQGALRWGDRSFCSPVRVAPPGTLDGIALLGRADFFSTFAVEFAWYRNPPSFTVDLPPAA